MKYLVYIILSLSTQVYAAVASTIVWEVRSTATAANANGCGYKTAASGTDWSQQDAAQYNLTNATSAAANAIILHASASADMVGNLAHVISGTNATPGWYEIISVSAGVSITVDRNWGTGAVASGVVNIGGACSLGSATANQTDTNFAAAIVAGNTIYYKSGTYTLGAQLNFSTACKAALPCKHSGYNTARNDGPTGSNRPTLNAGTTQTLFNAFSKIENLILTQSGINGPSDNNDSFYYNVKSTMSSTTAGRIALAPGTDSFFMNGELIAPFGTAIQCPNDCTVIGSYIHDSATGIKAAGNGNPVNIVNNVIAGTYTAGISRTTSSGLDTYLGNTIYGYENRVATAGISLGASVTNEKMLNNIIYGFATGVTVTTLGNNFEDYNDFNNNTADRSTITTGSHSIATAPAFVNVTNISGTAGSLSTVTLTDAAKNFNTVTDNVDYCYVSSGTGATAGAYLITGHTTTTLTLSTAPGGSGSNINYQIRLGNNFNVGSNMKAKGFPGAFPVISNTQSYLDLGAAQKRKTGSSAGGFGY